MCASYPSERSATTVCDPIKPVPPVTKIRPRTGGGEAEAPEEDAISFFKVIGKIKDAPAYYRRPGDKISFIKKREKYSTPRARKSKLQYAPFSS